jgi:uncharacterized protein YbjT (DUF2867 family)
MKSKVFVTGANGSLGQQLVNQLSEKNYQVTAALRDLSKAKFPTGVNAVKFDYTNPETYSAANDAAAVFLIAPPLDNAAPEKMAPFIDYLKKNTKATLVFNSVIGAELNEGAPLSKVEKHIMVSGLNYYFARPNFFMDNFIKSMAGDIKNGSYALPAEDKKTTFIAAKDIAEFEIALFEKSPEKRAYTLCGPDAISYYDTAKILSEVLGKEIKYIPITESDLINGMTKAGAPKHIIDYLAGLYQVVRAGYAAVGAPDFTEVTGRKATTFKEFVVENKQVWM